MYLDNAVREALGIASSDPPLELIQERVLATGYTGYVSSGFQMPEPIKPKRQRKPRAKADATADRVD